MAEPELQRREDMIKGFIDVVDRVGVTDSREIVFALLYFIANVVGTMPLDIRHEAGKQIAHEWLHLFDEAMTWPDPTVQ